MANNNELKGIYDVPAWFSALLAVTNVEDEPARDLILMVVLGIRSWVESKTQYILSERQRPFDLVHGLTVRNKMDQFYDMLWLLNESIEKHKGIFTTNDPKWAVLYALQDECNRTLETLHKARPLFHPPIM